MLRSIRKGTKSWIAYGIVGLIIMTFALFGIGDYLQGNYSQDVLKVGSVSVSYNEYSNSLQAQRRALQQEYGENYDQLVQEEQLVEQVKNNLINSAIWKNKVQDLDIGISVEQLQFVIQNHEDFQTDGIFDFDKYRSFLSASGYTASIFEFEQIKRMELSQVQNIFLNGQFNSDIETQQIVELQSQERQVNVLTLNMDTYTEEITSTDAELKKLYEDNIESYISPEKISVDYVLVSKSDVKNRIEINETQLRQHYSDTLDNYITPEQRQVRHILVEVGGNATPADYITALEKIEQVEQELNSGKNFATVAKTFSDDLGTNEKGGDLGFLNVGEMVAEFDEVLWELNPNEISKPIKTNFGYHIIEVTAVKEQSTIPYKLVESQVIDGLTNELVEQEYYKILEDLTNLSFENPDSLEVIKEQLNLKVATSDFFARSGKVDGNDPTTLEFMQAESFLTIAFGDEVKQEKLNSDLVPITDNSIAIIRLNSLIEEKQLSFETVQEKISLNFRQQQAVKNALNDANEWFELIKDNAITIDELLAKNTTKLSFEKYGWINRSDVDDTNKSYIISAAYRMQKPTLEQPNIYQVTGLTQGKPIIVQLTGVRLPELTEDNLKEEIDTNLLQVNSIVSIRKALDIYRQDYLVRETSLLENERNY